jgi:outer membrane protein assembly factor BamD
MIRIQFRAPCARKIETYSERLLDFGVYGKGFKQMIFRFPLCNLIFAILFLLAGCSSLPSLPSLPSFSWSSAAQPDASAETLYKEGVAFMNNKKYVLAIDRFQKLRSEHPFAPEIVSAELKLGEAYYLNEQYTEAVETLNEFQAMHPNNENIPFALYISGMANFDQFSSVDRDQKMTEVAKGFFERVVNNYPNSPYAAKSQEKLAKCLEYLAEHEYDIAAYYMREKKYPAARDRLEGILRRYKTTPTAAKALYDLGESYRLEKNNFKASLAYQALVQYYPTHPLAKSAQAQLSQLGKDKQDPLAILLKPEGRAAPVVAEAEKQAGEEKPARELNLVAKTEVVTENPGDEIGLFSRVVDKLNPFSSSAPAPAKTPQKTTDDKKDLPTDRLAATVGDGKPADNPKESSGGFFSSLWPFGKKEDATNTAAAKNLQKNPQLLGGIDESLQQRGISTQANAAPKPPAADLSEITEINLPTVNPTATLSAIDSKLEKQGKSVSAMPPPPEAAAALKVPFDEKAVARSKSSTPAPDTTGLLSGIDTKLKRQGIDPAQAEQPTKAEKAKADRPAGVASRSKPAEKIELEPRLGADNNPLLLPPQEFQPQGRSTATTEADKSKPVEPAPAVGSPSAPPKTLPELAVKGAPQPVKEKPAETRVAGKPKSPDEDEVEANKNVFDQIREDIGRIGKILNPFSW